jgi:hypothetical protein
VGCPQSSGPKTARSHYTNHRVPNGSQYFERFGYIVEPQHGGVAEWFKAAVLKTAVP